MTYAKPPRPDHYVADPRRCPTWPSDWRWAPPPPGETLCELLEFTGATVDDVARDSGLDAETINGILNATVAITPATASQLSRATGPSAQFWLNLQHLADTCPHVEGDRSG